MDKKNKTSGFKGLEIADMNFSREKIKCSKCIKDSCSLRDCNLEVYKLGDNTIYSGGLCPKGNTSSKTKIAPNYIKIYQRMLEDNLKKFSVDLKSGENRILIPRSLTFLNEKGLFYASLYNLLGFDVCISPESDEEISNLGKIHSHSEFCYPLILSHGHAAYLKKHMKPGDKILLVNVISSENEIYKFCPYVASSGYTIMGNLNLSKEDVLLPVIRFNDKAYPTYKAIYEDLKRVFGKRFSEKQVKEACENAEKINKEFLLEIYSKGKEIIDRLKENKEKIFIAIGRGYTIFDIKANSGVHELFANNGLHFIPSYFINHPNYDADSFAENMYWYQGREMLKYTLFSIENGFFPVRLTNFNCGTDSILHYHEENLMNYSGIPWLVLETDGHNSNAQFGTRIQAHNRVVQKYNGKGRLKEVKKEHKEDYENRIIGLPYMGDSSYVLASALKCIGFNTQVMPTATKRSLEISKKIINTNTCRPFSFQVGDQLAWLESFKEKGINPNEKVAIFLPKARGPCRFGQYSSVLKKIFQDHGFPEVPILSPSSENNYGDLGISKIRVLKMVFTFLKGLIANELLENILFRYRPYEISKGDCEKLYKESHKELLKLIEKNASLKEFEKFLELKAEEFEKIPKTKEKRRPLVLMNGEIFVRSHEDSNQDSIKLLEDNGLEVILEPTISWIHYVTENTLCKASERKDIKQILFSFISDKTIVHISKIFSQPFKEQLKGRLPHSTFGLILDLEDDLLFNHAIEGESGISIGEANAFIDGHMDIDGIYHVGPLGCMQETMATSRIQNLIQKKRENSKDIKSKLIPFMDAVFGESAVSNLDAQIAIFAENCRLRKQIREQEKD